MHETITPPASPPVDPRSFEPDDADGCLEIADLFGRAVRRLHRGTADALSPLGLSRAQARLVRLLAAGPLRMAAIADHLSVVPRTVTDLVDGVEAAGLVARQPDPDDRRSTLVALTPAGSELIDRLDVARRQSAEEVFGRVPTDDRAVLLRVLREVCTATGCGPHEHRRQDGLAVPGAGPDAGRPADPVRAAATPARGDRP